MMDILFGQSYYLRFDPKLWAAMQPYPPLGTLYAASYARSKGYSVALFDAMLAESEEEWGAALDQHRPRFACIFEDNFNYLSKMCLLRMREAAFTMIDMAKARGCAVIVCGADMTDHADLYLQRGADFVLLGEGELTLGELLDSLTGKSSQPLHGILGLATNAEYRIPNTQSSAPEIHPSSFILHPSHRPDIRDLDSLPFPAWDLVDVPRYRKLWRERHGYYSMNMVTTRGCPYHCNWCAKPIWGQRYNSRSPENVVAELKWLKEKYRPDHIWFADDIFGLKPGWIERFAGLVGEADASIPFKCLQRADLINESVAAALVAAGCKTVWLGAESGSQKILDAMDKGDTVQDIYNAAKWLKRTGIEAGFFLQFGYPGETWADIQLTLKMVRECRPDDIGVSVSYPLPGTRFFERVKMELGEKQNWIDSNDLAMLYRGPFPQEFYRILHGRVHYEFRLRRALKRPGWRAPVSVLRNLPGLLRSELRLRRMVAARD
ncbi:MAG: B12-binding domain-containing radical SAM protein [Chloroflexi bacterium]|nr:B12-binding domain-containing radical SAM protein [Chloroflexota bacterium]